MANGEKPLILGLAFVITQGYVQQSESQLDNSSMFSIFPNNVVEGTYHAIALSPTHMMSNYPSFRVYPRSEWSLQKDISNYPSLRAPNYPILQSLYNLALEEMIEDIRSDNVFMAGKEWQGVWTRDIAYSIHLALGLLSPDIAENSLRAKVSSKDEIIQDTGTGGSWPISTDRVVWALGAWEVFLVTGKRDFLEWSYKVLKNTALRDSKIAFDYHTGLYFGESSFMDWREQSYPLWMQPIDIFESISLSTSVLHQRFYFILSQMGELLNESKDEVIAWQKKTANLKESINRHLWNEVQHYYSSYLYPTQMGRMKSDKSDNLGQALAILFNISDKERSQQLMENIPVVPYGVPCLYPQQPHARPYHNKAIWPFVTAYYTLAGAHINNTEAVAHGMKSIVRAAALFLTHKENFDYQSGSPYTTVVNSDRQLWSVAGYLSLIYRVLFGVKFHPEGLSFHPFIPDFIEGPFILENFSYRQTKLKIIVQGKGSTIKEVKWDGKTQSKNFHIKTNEIGEHTLEILLTTKIKNYTINMVSPAEISPLETILELDSITHNAIKVKWQSREDVDKYLLYKNGNYYAETKETFYIDSTFNELKISPVVYSIIAVGKNGLKSNFSNPLYIHKVQTYTLGYPYLYLDGYLGETTSLKVIAEESGIYQINIEYANGNGPINTDNKCALRSLYVDNYRVGEIVMPQRDHWDNWGISSTLEIFLEKGEHQVNLSFGVEDINMNIDVNSVHVKNLRLIKK